MRSENEKKKCDFIILLWLIRYEPLSIKDYSTRILINR